MYHLHIWNEGFCALVLENEKDGVDCDTTGFKEWINFTFDVID
jgi:hypothetical protein